MIQIGGHKICQRCLRILALNSHRYAHTSWTSVTVRNSFIDFFCQSHDHKFVKSSPVIPKKNQGTYFTNAGMNQFKQIFLDAIDQNHPMAAYKRVVNSQKCVRVGGKHNDLEDVGKDLYHHTFFEMLGSWSFGDYFKKEACSMALELLTTVYKIPINRLYFTYFGGDSNFGLEADIETRDIWRCLGVPVERILPFGMKDNFWDMGDTGPCGPCTEIHYDHTGLNSVHLVNKGTSSDVLEIWNLVFMQYNRRSDGSLEPLHKVHVDTGMGLERMLAVLNHSTSTYNTDLFIPTFSAIQKYCNIRPYGGNIGNEIDTAYRIVADHIRMVSVCIADGLLPGSKNQGHKLRSVLFRCLYQSKKVLQMPYGLVPGLVDIVVNSLGDVFPELEENKHKIKEVVCEAENWFDNTILAGEKFFQKYLRKNPDLKHLSGETLMDMIDGRLTDGHCIPMEMFPDLGKVFDVLVDMEGLHHLLEQHQRTSVVKNEDKQKVVLSPESLKEVVQMGVKPTDDSQKYQYTKENNVYKFPQGSKAVIKSFIKDDNLFTEIAGDDDVGILLDKTVFYGESGGQAADTGYMKSNNGVFKVSDVQIFSKYVLHIGNMEQGKLCVGDTVTLYIDEEHRLGCMRNHTATHILNTCLRKSYNSVSQEGSRVLPNKFSFNFSSTTHLKPEDLCLLQHNVQRAIDSDFMVSREIKPLDHALQIPELITLKDEEYPSEVYIVRLGKDEDSFSQELCGGTHVMSTGDIKSFCITSASLTQLGIKRLTCLTGKLAEETIQHGMKLQNNYSELETNIKSGYLPETWFDRLKYLNQEMQKDLPKVVHDDLKQKVDRLAEIIKLKLNEIKKKDLKQVLLERLEDTADDFCTITTEIGLKFPAINEMLVDIKPNRPVAVIATDDKNTSVVICFNEHPKVDHAEKEIQRLDSNIKLKKIKKQNYVIINITCKDRSVKNGLIICDTFKRVLC